MLGSWGVHHLRPLGQQTATLWWERLVVKMKTTLLFLQSFHLHKNHFREETEVTDVAWWKDSTRPAESESDFNTNQHFLWHTGSLCAVCVQEGRTIAAALSFPVGFCFNVYLRHNKRAGEENNRTAWRTGPDTCYGFFFNCWGSCIQLGTCDLLRCTYLNKLFIYWGRIFLLLPPHTHSWQKTHLH